MTVVPFATARVVFRKQVSDGNYGTESAEVALDVPLGEAYDYDEESIAATLAAARRLVHEELRKSLAWRVRDAVTPSELPAEAVRGAEVDPEDLPL